MFGGRTLAELPVTHEEFDTKMRAVQKTQYSAGYLYYSLLDGYQQLRKDLGHWRVLVAAEKNATDPAIAARFARDRQIRETL